MDGWGKDFFSINDAGHVQVTPQGTAKGAIDLKELVEDLKSRGCNLPILIRFSDILKFRIEQLFGAFNAAIAEHDFKGRFRGVYPIKVNQQRHVVEELVEYGAPHGLGIEAGSKPELLVALALQENPDAYILCNGYKDKAFIETALLAQKLGRQVIITVDRAQEIDTIISCSRELGRAAGDRGARAARPPRARGNGSSPPAIDRSSASPPARWSTRSRSCRKEGMLDCLQLLHFHIGSQITAIRAIRDAMREASRIFVELHMMGANMRVHRLRRRPGRRLRRQPDQLPQSSVNYSLAEYARDIVSEISEACTAKGVPHPDIVTESGRALVAHHSVLVFNVLGSNEILPGQAPELVGADEHRIIQQLYETYMNVSVKNFQESYHDALQLKEEAVSAFTLGVLGLRERARVEQLFWAVCERILKIVRDLPYVPDDLESLEKQLTDTYYCNFSLFQSMPDHWAVNQLFPAMPIERLDQQPTRRAILADLTCDSDGKIDKFIDLRDVKHFLPLHALNGETYHIATFLVGAYQEILGDLHNLFGDTDAVHVKLAEDGYSVQHVVEGDSVTEVLSLRPVQQGRPDRTRAARGRGRPAREAPHHGRVGPPHEAVRGRPRGLHVPFIGRLAGGGEVQRPACPGESRDPVK